MILPEHTATLKTNDILVIFLDYFSLLLASKRGFEKYDIT